MASKDSFLLYHDIRTPLELLGDSDRGKLFLAILNYSEYREIPDFSGALEMAFAFIRAALDRDAQTWESKRAARVEAGRLGGLAKASNAKQQLANLAVPVPAPVPAPVPVPVPVPDKEGAATPPTHTRFVPPSVEEVRAYCAERRNHIDPERFCDYYSSVGWKIGEKPMKSWQAAVRTWERRDTNGASPNSAVASKQAESRWGKLQSVPLD